MALNSKGWNTLYSATTTWEITEILTFVSVQKSIAQSFSIAVKFDDPIPYSWRSAILLQIALLYEFTKRSSPLRPCLLFQHHFWRLPSFLSASTVHTKSVIWVTGKETTAGFSIRYHILHEYTSRDITHCPLFHVSP